MCLCSEEAACVIPYTGVMFGVLAGKLVGSLYNQELIPLH